MPSLVDERTRGFSDARVVLNQAIGDDDVTDGERRIQPTCDSREDHEPWRVSQEQRRGHHRHRDLADACFGVQHLVDVEQATPRIKPPADVHALPLGGRLEQQLGLLR